jgi:hypothetical protein
MKRKDKSKNIFKKPPQELKLKKPVGKNGRFTKERRKKIKKDPPIPHLMGENLKPKRKPNSSVIGAHIATLKRTRRIG